ncbi:MAG: hypothetical protein H6641_00850 [Caldilineaceae bacterium]|nr:hypothetical protein [Caldilineaceae bacterium]
MAYFWIENQNLQESGRLPQGAQPFAQVGPRLLPPQISALHQAFGQWGALGFSPGEIRAPRIWLTTSSTPVFQFANGRHPQRLMQVGLARELAAWLVLLDGYMETFVVIARARAHWNVDELAHALVFMTPAYLPPELTNGASAAHQWQRTAQALATAVADGPLAGAPSDQHWQEISRGVGE